MIYRKPIGGACGQQVTRGDAGYWRCEICGFNCIPEEAYLLIDSVLRCSDLDSDSYNQVEKEFADSIEALKIREN
jgi:hypothetical protein